MFVSTSNDGKLGLDIAYIDLGGFSAGYFGSAYKFYDGAFGVGSAYSPSGAGNKPVQIQYALNCGRRVPSRWPSRIAQKSPWDRS